MLLYSTIKTIIEKATSATGAPRVINNTIFYSNHENELSNKIAYNLTAFGFCIINAQNNYHANHVMNLLEKFFGPPQAQNKQGIVEQIVSPHNKASRYINNREAQPLHTDNGYAFTMPDFMALRCVRAAPKGGETLLVSSDTLLDYLRAKHSDNINLLYTNNAITYLNGLSRVSKNILNYTPDGQTEISFSIFADAIIGSTKECESVILSIIEFIHLPYNQQQYLLNDHDIIIVNNRTILHGRKAFEGERKLLRTWYNQKKQESVIRV